MEYFAKKMRFKEQKISNVINIFNRREMKKKCKTKLYKFATKNPDMKVFEKLHFTCYAKLRKL